MLARLLNVLGCIWRGAWRPTTMLPLQPRWYHYIDYWGLRVRDITAGVLLFLVPPAAAFFIYEKYSIAPRATIVFAVLVAAFWSLLAVTAYFTGRRHSS